MNTKIHISTSQHSLKDWQANLTTVFVVVMILGRAFKAIKSGGGLRVYIAAWCMEKTRRPPVATVSGNVSRSENKIDSK